MFIQLLGLIILNVEIVEIETIVNYRQYVIKMRVIISVIFMFLIINYRIIQNSFKIMIFRVIFTVQFVTNHNIG